MKRIHISTTLASLVMLGIVTFTPVSAQYGPIMMDPGTGGGSGVVPTITTPEYNWYTPPTTTYVPPTLPANDGSYAPTIGVPGAANQSYGTVGTSSTGWNGWNTGTTTGTGTSGTTTTGTTGTTTGGPSSVPSISTLGSSYVSSQVATVSGAWSSTGGVTGTWFEYGTSQGDLSLRSAGVQQNNLSGSWGEQLSGLAPATTYYYRAVSENSYGRNAGAIRSFRTRGLVVTTGTTGTTTTTTSGTTTGTTTGVVDTASTGAITITNRYTNICPADEIDYAINYKNTTGRRLTDVTIKMYLPTSIEYRSSTAGTYRSRENAVTVLVGSLNPNETGIFYVTGEATSDSYRSRLDARVEMLYNGTNGNQVKEDSVVSNTSTDCDNSSLGATALFGGGFFPTTFIGWLFLILFILFLVWVSRRFMYNKAAGHGADHH
jgi:hypothetical protein